MGRAERFEDLIAWQKARELTKLIYSVSGTADFGRDYGLRDQIRRAAVSVMSNIAEGYERGGSLEFRRFLSIAKASCGEVRSQLYVALDAKYISQQSFDQAQKMAIEVSRIVAGLRTSINRPRGK